MNWLFNQSDILSTASAFSSVTLRLCSIIKTLIIITLSSEGTHLIYLSVDWPEINSTLIYLLITLSACWMTLIIYAENKTYCYSKERSSGIKETADKTDTSVITVKILIYRAEDYISVINISAEGTSVIFSSLSTLFNDSTFYSSWAPFNLVIFYIRLYSSIMNFSSIILIWPYIIRELWAFCILLLTIFWDISYC